MQQAERVFTIMILPALVSWLLPPNPSHSQPPLTKACTVIPNRSAWPSRHLSQLALCASPGEGGHYPSRQLAGGIDSRMVSWEGALVHSSHTGASPLNPAKGFSSRGKVSATPGWGETEEAFCCHRTDKRTRRRWWLKRAGAG